MAFMPDEPVKTPLGFRLERADNGAWVKIRDDGRRGPAVGSEAELWQAMQAAEAENANLRKQVAGHCERIAAQSEALSKKAERAKK